MEEYIAEITPLLDSLVTALVKNRPTDPVKFLKDFLHRESSQESPKKNREEIVSEEPTSGGKGIDHLFVSSPTSQGLLSPTHSPSNVARYLGQGQRISIPAESTGDIMRRFGEDEQLINFPKSEQEIKYIFNLFRTCFLFSDKAESDLIPVFNALEKQVFDEPDSTVSVGNSVIFLSSGGLETERICKGQLELEIKGPGDVIGELGNVCDEYTKIVTTDPNTVIWKIDREYFDYLVRLCSHRRRERLLSLLASIPILASLDSEHHLKISDALKHAQFKSGQVIVSQGDSGDVFYIVESGNCTRDDGFHDVEQYGPGDFFGELSLINNEPHSATVTAASDDVSVLLLDKESFKRLLGPIEDLRDSGANSLI
jgi:cAMP-dependent protein kinase regulator